MRDRLNPLFGIVCLLIAMYVASGTSNGASSTLYVQANIMSATLLDTTGCASNTANVTGFGTVLPGTPTVTSSDCTIVFGSTNDTSMVKLRQADHHGAAMVDGEELRLDTSFDGDGIVTDDIEPTRDDNPRAATWEFGTNNLVVAATADNASNQDIVLTRYTTAGAVDTSWAVSGRRRIDLGGYEAAKSIYANEDGSFWVVGDSGSSSMNRDPTLYKITAAGALDTSFNGTGYRTYDQGFTWEWAQEMVPLTDGGWLLTTQYITGGYFRSRIVRLTSSMTLDPNFNAAIGYVEPTGSRDYYCSGIQVDQNNKFTCIGNVSNSATDADVLMMRRNVDGTADTTFDTDGTATFSIGTNVADNCYNQTALNAGKYLLACATNTGGAISGALLQVTSTGGLDPGFNTTGKLTKLFGTDLSAFLTAYPDAGGGYRVLGIAAVSGKVRYAVGRLTSALAWDTTTFTGAGYTSVDVAPSASAYSPLFAPSVGYSPNAAMTDQQRPAFIGYTSNTDIETTIAVMTNDYTPDYANGSTDWDQGSGMFGVCLRSVGASTAAQWPTTGTCGQTDGTNWRAVPATSSKVASATANVSTASFSLRFGFRPRTNQRPGTYSAPIQMDVYAPDA